MGIFDVFKKKKSASSNNKTAIINLANDIHKKFMMLFLLGHGHLENLF